MNINITDLSADTNKVNVNIVKNNDISAGWGYVLLLLLIVIYLSSFIIK